MRDIVTQGSGVRSGALRPRHRLQLGLAGRLIGLIAAFVMLAQVVIYTPAIVNFRFNWLRNRLAAAHTAALVLEAAPSGMISPALEREVLSSVGARLIVLNKDGARHVLATGVMPDKVDATYDLRNPSWPEMLGAVYHTMAAPAGGVLTVLGAAPMGGEAVEVTMDEAPLKEAIVAFSHRLIIYTLIVSAIVGGLAAFALHRMILAPVRRLTTSIVDFGADPSERQRIIAPSRASHEIGQAERALAVMQEALALEISQRKNLANLGLAVAKINHDMRNMLSAAQILSDRLATTTDPLAQRLAPKLVATLDRAIRFCQATLTYGRATDEPPRPRLLDLRAVVAEAAETVLPVVHGVVEIRNAVPDGFGVMADAEQMFRILMNLMRNGVEALERAGAAPGRAPSVEVRAWHDPAHAVIEVSDTGPGIPMAVRPKIFTAFHNSQRPGGSGLGLAIVADLIRAHGGTIVLQDEVEDGGATFRIALPRPMPSR